eukprot:CAMPEP_0119335742 /NCGR_PEP_ID=MMETSP1333-20130426/90214_1 /TAXON_ID=418940 /ORGANISM="Scyphosphaera apsteinii, Strain RCC1455" /LENGTH=421 /DNA_ID=CAMNT_0007346375 /DNA_START=88 /DNA_END=1353 /DNA_ORIENTATION=+
MAEREHGVKRVRPTDEASAQKDEIVSDIWEQRFGRLAAFAFSHGVSAAAIAKIEGTKKPDGEPTALWLGKRVFVEGKTGTGCVRFVGKTVFANGTWLGVEMDKAVGKHNGVVDGVRYFSCQHEHGLMLPQSAGAVTIASKTAVADMEASDLVAYMEAVKYQEPEEPPPSEWHSSRAPFPQTERANRQVVAAAVAKDGLNLCFAASRLKGDKELVLVAMRNGGQLCDASIELRADREVVVEAVRHGDRSSGGQLQFACGDLCADKAVVLDAVRHSSTAAGSALWHACASLREDKEVVVAAVQANGMGLAYASAELKRNKEIALHAVRQTGEALECVHESLKHDKDVVLTAIEKCRALTSGGGLHAHFFVAWRHAKPLWGDKEVALAGVSQCHHVFDNIPDELQHDEQILSAFETRKNFVEEK